MILKEKELDKNKGMVLKIVQLENSEQARLVLYERDNIGEVFGRGEYAGELNLDDLKYYFNLIYSVEDFHALSKRARDVVKGVLEE